MGIVNRHRSHASSNGATPSGGSSPALVRKAAPSSREEARQRLRLNRFLLASAFSVVYLLVLALFSLQGKVDTATLAEAWTIVAIFIVTFFGIFRLGFNLRFADPSLTAFQVLAAVFTMLFVVYRAPETRLVFATFLFVALMFGMLRSSATQLTILGVVSLGSFAIVALVRYADTGDTEMLRIDLLQLCVTALALPWFLFLGTRVKRLKEADRRKDEFLATLAHELRNPLAPIRMGIHILRRTRADSHAQSVLPMMERQVQHLTRLLDDLLDVSRITQGKVTLRVERVDLRHVAQAAVEASRPAIREERHDLTVSLPGEPLWVDGDPVRLAQVLSNLLNNAAKYTPEGGRIALKAERIGDDVELCVSDNGYGIPRERLESIFDMFTQLDSPVAKSGGGLGIGLSLAKGLVALHRGTIEARSEGPGRGSDFHVRLPAGPSRADDPPTVANEPIIEAKSKVLIVDDNRDVTASLAMFLQLMGHDVRVANDGERAVQLAEEFRPHTIFLDLGMPGINGYEACRRIRDATWGKQMRVIAITGWGQDEDRRKSAIAGFDLHLVKPVNPEMLGQLLREPGRAA
ncbi:MAG TPA: ATP-binding protein [Casimicrobiaceae bacterium]|nr:ATP-binding protein [Casimicrobiaceae bacterium]